MANLAEIVSGLAQAAANAYDGALDENGDPLEIGLNRENNRGVKGMYKRPMMDGFKVSFSANQMIVKYTSEIMIQEANPRNKFNDEIERRFADITKFLKKEYNRLRKESVSLSPVGDASIILNSMSSVRSWVEARKVYEIGGSDGAESLRKPSGDSLEANFKKFLELNSDKKSPNDKAPANPDTPDS